MNADDKVNMTLDDIIKMDRKYFKKGPGSVHSVATVRSNFSMNSQRSRTTQKSWGSQRSRVPHRDRSLSRGRQSRSHTPARSEMTIPRFPQQNRRNGSTASFPVSHQKRKMAYRYLTSSGMKNQKQSNGFYITPYNFQRRYRPYNQSSVWTRLQYAKNRVRLAKQTLNRSQKLYIQQLKELQNQLITNTVNYNTSPQFRYRNNFLKGANTMTNPVSSPPPKQSLTICIRNELAIRNLSRARGGKLFHNRSNVGNVNKGYLKKLSAGKTFQSPVSLQKKFGYKNQKQPLILYENEPENCPGVVPWDTLMVSVPSVTSSSLNERFSNN